MDFASLGNSRHPSWSSQLLKPIHHGIQWRIQDFPEEGAPTPKTAIIL